MECLIPAGMIIGPMAWTLSLMFSVPLLFACTTFSSIRFLNCYYSSGRIPTDSSFSTRLSPCFFPFRRAQEKGVEHQSISVLNTEVEERWIKPVVGSIKFNCDAAVFSAENKYGFGWLARDHEGRLIEAVARARVGKVTPQLAEAVGLKEVLSWIKTQVGAGEGSQLHQTNNDNKNLIDINNVWESDSVFLNGTVLGLRSNGKVLLGNGSRSGRLVSNNVEKDEMMDFEWVSPTDQKDEMMDFGVPGSILFWICCKMNTLKFSLAANPVWLFISQQKQKYVTTYELQQQQRNKMSTVVCGPKKSPRLNKQQVKNPQVRNSNVIKNSTEVTSHRRSTPMTNQQDLSNATVNLNSATVRRRLDLLNPPDEHEATDENEILDLPLPPPPPLTEFDKKTCININNLPEYERLKMLNVMQNNEVYKAMKLPTLAIGVRNEFRKCKGKEKIQQESEEYIPPEHEEQSENETVKTPKKRTKKVEKTKLNIGPTTRSRANILVEKDASEKDVGNSVPAEPAPECAIQLPRNEGIGTMAAYLLLRDNQKKNAGNGSASGSGTAKGKAVAENDLPDIENEVVDEGT
ncbi:hypothetical protein POM88_050416 [Heracleum sosnowskyi]|uniref:RNase H type-1 domain-containing protein n=1 Tax=Heracleum sosnowskyi TaxID=360622 RepID=A0AAD8H041_9APIA|nr:hypothetical protein POM88_050416 [Heracleum sosnowskyi]